MFVCHGNICRSPMAEFIMKDLVRRRGLDNDVYIESSATSYEEIGNDIYPQAAFALSQHNIEYSHREARRFTQSDYNNFDMVVVMEKYNISNLMRIIGNDDCGKVWKLLDFMGQPVERCTGNDISDPWYHGNFNKTYKEILAGCVALLNYLGY